MPDLRQKIREELDDLLLEATVICAKEAASSTDAFGKALREVFGDGDAETGRKTSKRSKAVERGAAERRREALIARATEDPFSKSYQRWYTMALPVVQQILPDRHAEFLELYRLDKPPKALDPSTYTISDYVRGIVVTRGLASTPVFEPAVVALTRFQRQIEILDSARARLHSTLADIQGTVEAMLLDDELDVARELLKSKYLRAAGVVAGVVLERHLRRVVDNHAITFRKKSQIGNLNDALKEAGIYGVPQWRFIQRLADLRNLCGHAGDHDPTAEDLQDLVDGVAKVVATVF